MQISLIYQYNKKTIRIPRHCRQYLLLLRTDSVGNVPLPFDCNNLPIIYSKVRAMVIERTFYSQGETYDLGIEYRRVTSRTILFS